MNLLENLSIGYKYLENSSDSTILISYIVM